MQRIGALMLYKADSREGQDYVRAFQQALQKLGWNDGRNVQIDICWGGNTVDRARQCATELVALMPDVVLAAGFPSATAVQHLRPTLPIVFVQVVDPVGFGLVDSLDRPGRQHHRFHELRI